MTNLIHILDGTPVVWAVGGTPDLDLGGLAANAVRVGEQVDLGSGSRPKEYAWSFRCDGFDSAPVVGEIINIYLAYMQGTNIDGDVGSADAAGVVVALPQLDHIGSVTVQTTTASNPLITSGEITIKHRYVSVVIHNVTADALLGAADAHTFTLTPVPDQVQDAA